MPNAILNGCKHHWEESGSGEPLIMLHGAAGSGRAFAAHLPELSKTYRVIAPDLRGMGQSEHVKSIPPSGWVDDVKALIDYLDLGSTHLYGVSLGARIAMRAAVDHPGAVRSLVLEAPIVANEAEGNAQLNANLGSSDNLSPEQQRQRELQHGPDWQDVLTNFFSIRNDPAVQEYLNLRELSKQIAVPTLILRGDVWEPVHPLPHAVELHASIKGSWLWIRPNSPTNVLGQAPQEAYALIRALTATASKEAAAVR
jgi:pimeloyl-ACP methyl ester carboxylesterase